MIKLSRQPRSTQAALSARKSRSRLFRKVVADKVVLASIVFLFLLVTATLVAKLVGVDASTARIAERLLAPSWEHPLGTDGLGRDVLMRTILGAYNSIIIGLGAVLISGTVGTAMGILAGYFGGRWDAFVMRLVEIQFAFPNLLLIVAVVYFFEASVSILIVVLAAVYWMVFATVVRSAVMTAKTSLFVRAAHFAGCSTSTIVARHILPAVAPIILTQAMLEFAAVVLAESGLSFLGLGVQPPAASWGLMIAESHDYMEDAWWSVFFPGLAIVLTVLAANLIGSAFRVWLDPRQNTERNAEDVATAEVTV
jgi:peptide/nickel transport system permease protein